MSNNAASPHSAAAVREVIDKTAVLDMHTHLFAPRLKGLMLWGIDELLTYHYLEAELFRCSAIQPSAYSSLSKREQADLIWRSLFVDRLPLSESTRGIVAVLQALGLDTRAQTLTGARDYFRSVDLEEHTANVLRLAGVSAVVMTNDPLDQEESAVWRLYGTPDPRFRAALRIDRILNDLPAHCELLSRLGFPCDAEAGSATVASLRRFLAEQARMIEPLYMAVSLPDIFAFPADDLRTRLLREAILPTCRELNLPLAMMIGVRRQVNPALRLAGDGVGPADLTSLERLCLEWPRNRFLVTLLSRENQHQLCVYARKFANLMPFGCWWFLNNPSIVEEMTRERLEMLGTTFVPQHSDARVLEQLIYKWRNSRRTISGVLATACDLLADDGRPVTVPEMAADAQRLLSGNFESFCAGSR